MGRKKVEIPRKGFIETIQKLENAKDYPNQAALFRDVADSEFGRKHGITAAIVPSRVKEFKVKLKTKPGKRGRPGGVPNQNRGVRTKRADKFAAHFGDDFEKMKKLYPARFHKTIDQLAKGSMKAAVKLNCVACVGYGDNDNSLAEDIGNCNMGLKCSLFPFRPYQGKAKVAKEDDESDESDESIAA